MKDYRICVYLTKNFRKMEINLQWQKKQISGSMKRAGAKRTEGTSYKW